MEKLFAMFLVSFMAFLCSDCHNACAADDSAVWLRRQIEIGDIRSDVTQLLRFHQFHFQKFDRAVSAGNRRDTDPADWSVYLPRERKLLLLAFDEGGVLTQIDVASKIVEPSAVKDDYKISTVNRFVFSHRVIMAKVTVGDEAKTAIGILKQDWRRAATFGVRGPNSFLVDKKLLVIEVEESRVKSMVYDERNITQIEVPILQKLDSEDESKFQGLNEAILNGERQGK